MRLSMHHQGVAPTSASRRSPLQSVQCNPLRRQPRYNSSSRLITRNSSAGSDTDSDTASEEQAEDALSGLHRMNKIQQGEQEGGDRCIGCWGLGDLPKHHTSRRGVSNVVQLSAYPDCIGKGLTDLQGFLEQHVDGAIGGVHLLPVYPSTGDRGFAPVTYQQVDPKFGTWENVRSLAEEYELCMEFMGHLSPASEQFQDYLQHGEASQFAHMFVKWADIWPGGKPSAEQLARVRTRKPAPPVIKVELADGSVVPVWCTFSDQQIDINPFSEAGWQFTEASLRSLCTNAGARLIRLDALGYTTKKAGTSCFMEAPEVWQLLERIGEVVKPYGVQLLAEVHEDFKLNIELARHGFWVYDFALPFLLLHAMRFKTAEPLKHWLSICPRRQITTLDTHDGMGVDDVAGLAPLVDVREVEQAILGLGGTVNYKHYYEPKVKEDCSDGEEDGTDCQRCSVSSQASLKAVEDCLQPDCMKGCYTSVQHQYNATYFSAMSEDPKLYLMARAVQFFTPGVPMVYYVGLLAGRNDYELLRAGGIRDINRHSYTLEEAAEVVRRPVVQGLLKLCRFRNFHPAFKGRVFVDDSTPPHLLRVCWYQGSRHLVVLRADFQAQEFSISHTPYRAPKAADAEAEETELQSMAWWQGTSEYGLDLSQVFIGDNLDMFERAEARHHLAPHAEEMGVVDPEDLLKVKASSGGSNGSSSGGSNARSSNGSSTGGSSNGSSSNGSSSRSSNGSSGSSILSEQGGSSDETDSSSVIQQAPGKVNKAHEGAGDAGTDTDDGSNRSREQLETVSSRETDWGLLQLDLSFAWQLEDKPLADVNTVLADAAVTAN